MMRTSVIQRLPTRNLQFALLLGIHVSIVCQVGHLLDELPESVHRRSIQVFVVWNLKTSPFTITLTHQCDVDARELMRRQCEVGARFVGISWNDYAISEHVSLKHNIIQCATYILTE